MLIGRLLALILGVSGVSAMAADARQAALGSNYAAPAGIGKELLGTPIMGRGSVQWWPNGNKTNDFKRSWKEFAKLLETAMSK